MHILITICARGGSKGIPNKNVRQLNGLPLIAYSISTAKKFQKAFSHYNVDIALSTDSELIKEVAASFGLETTYKRPETLAGDSAGKVETINDVRSYYQNEKGILYDYILDLDVSSPMRTLEDIIEAFEIVKGNSEALNLFSVNKAVKNPYFNLVEEENGFFGVSKKIAGGILSRQAAPSVFELNASFYIYRKAFFEQGFNTVYSGKALIYEMPHICFDIDHVIDFEFLSYLMANKKLDFELI